jgi:hypothetical protein
MNKDRNTLLRIEELHEPRHLFILPSWANPQILDRLIQEGYLTFSHLQRTKGAISLVMGLKLTEKGSRTIEDRFDWPGLALKGSLAGASFIAISMAILFLA